MTRYIRVFCFATLAGMTLLLGTSLVAGGEFYVSPTGSGDRCSKRAPCTLSAAQQAVRGAAANQSEDIHINLLSGTYPLKRPLALVESATASDSGRNGHKIIWQAAPEARPVLSGGVSVGRWGLFDKTRNIWRADAPAGLNARQLYVNGRRAERTRSADMMAGFTATERGFRLLDPVSKQPFDISKYRNLTDVEVLRLWEWQSSRCNVTDATSTDINVHPICLFNSKIVDLGLFVENAYELLSKPGQWYLDRAGTIGGKPSVYYLPRRDDKMASARAVLGATEKLLTLTGAGPEQPIHDIGFKGLTFSYGTWFVDQSLAGKVGGYSSIQAGVHMLNAANWRKLDEVTSSGGLKPPTDTVGGFYDPTNLSYMDYVPGVVTANYAQRIGFLDNTFAHMGASALAMVRGIKGAQLTGNVFYDISGSAIQLGGVETEDHHPCGDVPECSNGRVTENNLIGNNRISETSQEFFDTTAIFVGYARNTEITHNELFDLPYTAISVGWGWALDDKDGFYGYKNATIAAHNRITYNHIDRFMTMQRDGGGVYTLSAQPGSLIANNYINDGRHHFAGIYQDQGSEGFLVENNVTLKVPNFLHLTCSSPNGVTSNNTYRNNFSDNGPLSLNCKRAKNMIETPAVFDAKADEHTWPSEVKAIRDKSGLEPEFKQRSQGKITSVELGEKK